MTIPVLRCYSRSRSYMRAAACVLLCALFVAPKVSLALASVLGSGYRVVVLCSGSDLIRVTISPDGKIVEDVSKSWVGSHCAPVTSDTQTLQRVWQRMTFPLLQQDKLPLTVEQSRPILEILSGLSSRGPPRLSRV